MSIFWNEHLKEVHHQNHPQSATTTDNLQSATTTDNLREKICILHHLQNRTLPQHQDDYFYTKLETHLATATPTNMRNYIHCYKQAIKISCNQYTADLQKQRAVYSYLGFSRNLLGPQTPRLPSLNLDPALPPAQHPPLPL
jgi:hypothetical protein